MSISAHMVYIYHPIAGTFTNIMAAAVLRNQGPGARYKLKTLLDFMIIYMLQILKNNCELKPSKRAPQQ
jgi:hypothetical protein